MLKGCKECDLYEKRQQALRDLRLHLWRRGELTENAAENLTYEGRRISADLQQHQASAHPAQPFLVTYRGNDLSGAEEEIRRRAYELYKERGRQPGHDVDDWLRAEAEITAAATKKTSAARS
jgi:hypothetical protein